MSEVIPGVTKADTEDDNGQRSDSIADISNNEEEQAIYENGRMWTVSQLHQLFHLLLRRSKVRSRLDINDADTAKLQKQVAELERWRGELENRWAERHTEVNNKFSSDDARF